MTNGNYSPWARRLHWLVFALVACALLLIYLHAWTDRSSALHERAKWAHTQFGMAILLVMLPRLLVRSRRRAPPRIPPLPGWQDGLARAMHVALYTLLVVTPLLGIANRMWNPAPWDFLGIPLPHMAMTDGHFAHQLEDLHETFGNVLMYLAALHAAAALLHHYLKRDNVLRRMLPPLRSGD